jgi:hypothetical protein
VLHCFSEEILDTQVHFQVIDLGRQLYVWAGTGEARMGALCLAAAPAGAGSHCFILGLLCSRMPYSAGDVQECHLRQAKGLGVGC